MKLKIAVIPGDGIGPDIVAEGIKVLGEVAKKFNHTLDFSFYLAGGVAIDSVGEPLPESTLLGCADAQAVLLGSVGGPKWDDLKGDMRPEKALLGLRGGLKLFCNLRPAILYRQLSEACPLKDHIIEGGLDLMVVRELTGGIYFGDRGRNENGTRAYDTMAYSELEVERIARKAFELAMKRKKKLMSVDKANILESSRLWRSVVNRVATEYPLVTVSHMYVDNAAMQLVRNPKQFDVIVTTNMFGDILSDEASMITGSIGMLPSASLREDSFGMYEPIHGSAPDIAGQDKANPIATILSVAMMLRHSFNLEEEAAVIETAISKVLDDGYRTLDIMSSQMHPVGTKEMGSLIAQAI
ncbi:MAG: 3-isopropylmalate dehydrogenase [Sphaerochaetaceae bacterium]|jgi:3-isopropylmalate dehydrogenase|nr:3-isopropylmalate dehydrogenase [Sphaerochaetaceae bacterium]NLO59464.1 3-isopropylmalate dehydrogenase [Spirochaetales bacterium]MDD2405261.1 3-isopropylmalate dehydrogenase [Sphaerochaetaceae bacterium]MDD4259135.1 3-isopropylmalate dehydrogenase [Sphaerochaetaceae bacterium]MDD4763772.1 3-isopropylmalate dehydrogenase [Sphaerochaetaceae bacterium]